MSGSEGPLPAHVVIRGEYEPEHGGFIVPRPSPFTQPAQPRWTPPPPPWAVNAEPEPTTSEIVEPPMPSDDEIASWDPPPPAVFVERDERDDET